MIELRDVSKAYPGSGNEGVSRLSLTIAQGEFLALIGPSGSGKTTTLNMVNRLVEPDSGAIWIEGRNVAESDPVQLRRGIGYVFQEAGLFPHMRVSENIAVTPRLMGWDDGKIQARIDELLALVRLEPAVFRERRPQELSGGQRQRVALARALAAKPHILLLDEPFGALDPVTREAVAADVRDIHQRLGLTTLMVTHDMTEALLLADRIAVMRKGTLVQTGTPQELARQPADAFVAQLMETPRRRAQALAQMLAL
ncbi:MAG TPA: ATP-binding cassette domain-containing protein [Rhizomicrobium sp.]|nr:ATP-binding cassette domain-containing protein [Rhizomicrobium sp.]